MRNYISLSFLLLCCLSSFAQESKKPSIRPLLAFEAGIATNSTKNMEKELYGSSSKIILPHGSIRLGLSAGLFIGDRQSVAFTYNTSLNSSGSSNREDESSSLGMWYQYRILKDKPFFVQAGLSTTSMTLYTYQNGEVPPVGADGSEDPTYNIAGFQLNTVGINLAVAYEIVATSQLSIYAQLGYLVNYGNSSWHQKEFFNTAEYYSPQLPKDNLNGLFFKLIFQIDFVNAFKSK